MVMTEDERSTESSSEDDDEERADGIHVSNMGTDFRAADEENGGAAGISPEVDDKKGTVKDRQELKLPCGQIKLGRSAGIDYLLI